MNWKSLEDISQISSIINESADKPVMIFKHSTRCSISSAAKNRIERAWFDKNEEKLTPYYLDLLNHRDISSEIASLFNVEHQSPQVLLIKNGQCYYHESHMGINLGEVISHVDL